GLEKFRQWRRPGPTAAPAMPNLTVVNPVMWPSFATAPSRGLNRRLLARQLAPVVRALPTPPVAVTKTAAVAALIRRLPAQRGGSGGGCTTAWTTSANGPGWTRTRYGRWRPTSSPG